MISLRKIPVADITGIYRSKESATGNYVKRYLEIRSYTQSFYIFLLGLVLYTFNSIFIDSGDWRQILLVYSRYSLWPLTVIGIIIATSIGSKERFGQSILPIFPFFCIGLISTIFGSDIIGSLKSLVFWAFGVTAAAAIGNMVSPKNVQRALFWYLAAIMIGTILLIVVDPHLAVGTDSRGPLGTGSWRGPLPGKNALGWLSAFAMIVGLFVQGIKMRWRIVTLLATFCCAVMSGSQGGLVSGIGAVGFAIVVVTLRRLPWSPGARVAMLATLALIALPILVLASGAVLAALGRDVTLTGRTDIWAAYLPRALEYWPIGAGPGSFTSDSSATEDLAMRFAKLGAIHTPHNIFIGVLGETGIVGLIAWLMPMCYVAFVLPFRSAAKLALPTSAMAFSLMLGGTIETREVFGPAIGMFLIILMWTATRREDAGLAGLLDGGVLEVGVSEARGSDAGLSEVGGSDESGPAARAPAADVRPEPAYRIPVLGG